MTKLLFEPANLVAYQLQKSERGQYSSIAIGAGNVRADGCGIDIRLDAIPLRGDLTLNFLIFRREEDGRAYFRNSGGELMSCPIHLDGPLDVENAIYVSDFDEPLTKESLAEIERSLV